MAYIKKVERLKNNNENSFYKSKRNFIYTKIYNTKKWRKIRMIKIKEKPLCEECFANGIYKLATCVHHKKHITEGKSNEEMIKIGFDYNNLQSLCDECHKAKHTIIVNYFLFDDNNDTNNIKNE